VISPSGGGQYLMKNLFKVLLKPFLNEDGKSGGSQTTIKEPDPTPKHQELLKAQVELERINQDLINKFSSRYEELSADQLDALTQQLDMQTQMQQDLMADLSPTEQEQMSKEIERELIGQQMGYAQGEMPELTMEEAAGLEAYSQLAKEQVREGALNQQENEMLQSKNISLSRGLGSSSFRESLEGDAASRALSTIGGAGREIEGLKMQAAWDMPRATQTFNSGLLELQQSLNLQAEQNRASLAASFASSGVMGGIPTTYPSVTGTNFQAREPGTLAANPIPAWTPKATVKLGRDN